VLARVTNVKSGWKSVFMVFNTAAGDKDPEIARLAFDTIERIVREHFVHITETETSTFTDCVNCLISFTNNPHSDNRDIALNSIAFLRFCAGEKWIIYIKISLFFTHLTFNRGGNTTLPLPMQARGSRCWTNPFISFGGNILLWGF
jgi:hypothetical protein